MEPEKRPPGVMLYFTEMRPIFALLSAEERGELILKILDYAEYDEEPVFSFESRLNDVWPFVRRMLDRDAAAYKKKCERAQKAIRARWDREHGADRKEGGRQSEGRT